MHFTHKILVLWIECDFKVDLWIEPMALLNQFIDKVFDAFFFHQCCFSLSLFHIEKWLRKCSQIEDDTHIHCMLSTVNGVCSAAAAAIDLYIWTYTHKLWNSFDYNRSRFICRYCINFIAFHVMDVHICVV